MKKGLGVLAVFCIATSAFAEQPIVGGERVAAGDIIARSTVALADGSKNVFCTGTLISRDLVLTAAHCLLWGTANPKVAFGTERANFVFRDSVGTKVHPKQDIYNGKFDMAVFKFAGGLPDGFAPVALLAPEYALSAGRVMLLAGFGINNESTQAFGDLRSVEVLLSSIQDDHILVTDQREGRGGCNGDSGGPAYMRTGQGPTERLLVYGVTRGPHAGAQDCHHFGEYTYGSKEKAFILDSATALGAEAPVFAAP